MFMKNILIVHQGSEYCTDLAKHLNTNGQRTLVVPSGERALEVLASELAHDISLIFMSLDLPGIGGLAVLTRTRELSSTPVIALIEAADEEAAVRALDLGADDCVVKGTRFKEICARANAVLRRSTVIWNHRPIPNGATVFGDISIYLESRVAKVGRSPIALTRVEFEILRHLMKAAGQNVNRILLHVSVLQREFDPLDRSIGVHISNIRRKLRHHCARVTIQSVRNTGYALVMTE
jgi:two-component system response regulator CpxR